MVVPIPALANTRVIVPVLNGGERWREAAQALRRCVPTPSTVVVVDSGSVDGSDIIAAELGFEIERIKPRSFNHGRTRQEAVNKYCTGRAFVVFLTHDAVLEESESLAALLAAFDHPRTGAAYGRQLPHYDARPFARHSSLYLYPEDNTIRSIDDADRYGLKNTHLSNSYAAYRLQALQECGGFPSNLILGEDAYVAFRMLRNGWTISYRATATVRHSHNYSLLEEMRRYFDYGVLHAQMPELLKKPAAAEHEGMKFVRSELRFMVTSAPWLLPLVPIRNASKYLGYRLGRRFSSLPNFLRRRLSMTRRYWDAGSASGSASNDR